MLDPMLVTVAAQFPGCCIACRGQQSPFVDTHVELVDGQRVYLCSRCVRVHGEAAGMIPKDLYDRVEERAADLGVQVTRLETELADAQPILQSLARASSRYGTGDDD